MMTTQLQEFNLPVLSVPAQNTDAADVPTEMPYYDVMSAEALPADVSSECDHITVYSDGCTAVNAGSKDAMALFDMTLCVCCCDPATGRMTTYRVVKRLAFDKAKLAAQAEHSTPISVVEAVDPELKARTEHRVKRFRAMAGLED
jgi:hypothetical protein